MGLLPSNNQLTNDYIILGHFIASYFVEQKWFKQIKTRYFICFFIFPKNALVSQVEE